LIHRRSARAAWLAILLLAAAPLAGQTGGEDAGILLFILSPRPNEAALGEILFEAEVLGASIERVVLRVDGREVARFTEPPYRTPVALGDSVAAHRFEVIAFDAQGEVARARRDTPALAVDEAIDLELRQLYVTLEGAGADGERLAAGDFEVVDDGERQSLVTFEGGQAALTVALLIDASVSMRGGALAAALEGARQFVGRMAPLDEAAVYLFSDAVRFRSPFTQDPGALRGALDRVPAEGGTAINDTLYLALRQLEGRQGRRVVILLSDGVDVHSALRARDVLWTLRRCRSMIYWVQLEGEGGAGGALSPWRNSAGHLEEQEGLLQAVEESGGRVLPIAGAEQTAAAFAEVLDELRSQYVLGYYPSVDRDDGRWHDVKVRARRRGVRARTRGGYVDD